MRLAILLLAVFTFSQGEELAKATGSHSDGRKLAENLYGAADPAPIVVPPIVYPTTPIVFPTVPTVPTIPVEPIVPTIPVVPVVPTIPVEPIVPTIPVTPAPAVCDTSSSNSPFHLTFLNDQSSSGSRTVCFTLSSQVCLTESPCCSMDCGSMSIVTDIACGATATAATVTTVAGATKNVLVAAFAPLTLNIALSAAEAAGATVCVNVAEYCEASVMCPSGSCAYTLINTAVTCCPSGLVPMTPPAPVVPVPVLPIPDPVLPITDPVLPLVPIDYCPLKITLTALPQGLTPIACPKALQAISILLSGTPYEGYTTNDFMSCDLNPAFLTITIAGMDTVLSTEVSGFIDANIEFIITVGGFPCDSTVIVSTCSGDLPPHVCSPVCPSLCCSGNKAPTPSQPCDFTVVITAPIFLPDNSCALALRAFQILLGRWPTYVNGATCSFQFNKLVLTIPACGPLDSVAIASLLTAGWGQFFLAAGFPCGSTAVVVGCSGGQLSYSCLNYPAMCCAIAPPPPPGVRPGVCVVTVIVKNPTPFNPNVPPCPTIIRSLTNVLGQPWAFYAPSITCSWVGNNATVSIISRGTDSDSISQTILAFMNYFVQGAGLDCGAVVQVGTCDGPIVPAAQCSAAYPSLCCASPPPPPCPITFTITNPAVNTYPGNNGIPVNFTSQSCPLLISALQQKMTGDLVAYWTNIVCAFQNNTMVLSILGVPPQDSTVIVGIFTNYLNNIVATAKIPCGSTITQKSACGVTPPATYACSPVYPALCCAPPPPVVPLGCPVEISVLIPSRISFAPAACPTAINSTAQVLSPGLREKPVNCEYSGNLMVLVIYNLDNAQSQDVKAAILASLNAWILGAALPCNSEISIRSCNDGPDPTTGGTKVTCNSGFTNAPALCCPTAKCGLYITATSPTGWTDDSCPIALRGLQIYMQLNGTWLDYVDKLQCSYQGYTLAITVSPMYDQDAWALMQQLSLAMNGLASALGLPCGTTVKVNTCNSVVLCTGCPAVVITPQTFVCGPNLNNLCCNTRPQPCATSVTLVNTKPLFNAVTCNLATQSLVYIMKSGFGRFISNVNCHVSPDQKTMTLTVSNMGYDQAANLAVLVSSAIEAFIIGASVPCGTRIEVKSCRSSTRIFNDKSNPSLACPPSPPPPFVPRGCPLWIQIKVPTGPYFGPSSCSLMLNSLRSALGVYITNTSVVPYVNCDYDDLTLLLTVDSLLPTVASDLQNRLALAMNNFVLGARLPCGSTVHLETCDECTDCGGWHPSPKQTFTCSASVPALCCPPCPTTLTINAPAGTAPFTPGINWCFFAIAAVRAQLAANPTLQSKAKDLTCSFTNTSLVVTLPSVGDPGAALAGVMWINNINDIITTAGWSSPNLCGSTILVGNCKTPAVPITCSHAVPTLCCNPFPPESPPPPPTPPATFVTVTITAPAPATFTPASCASGSTAIMDLLGLPPSMSDMVTCSSTSTQMVITISGLDAGTCQFCQAPMVAGSLYSNINTWVPAAFGTQCVTTIEITSNQATAQTATCSPSTQVLCCKAPIPSGTCNLVINTTSPIPLATSSCQAATQYLTQQLAAAGLSQYSSSVTCSIQGNQLVLTVPNMAAADSVQTQQVFWGLINNFVVATNLPCQSQITVRTICAQGIATQPQTASCDPVNFQSLCCNGPFPSSCGVVITITSPTSWTSPPCPAIIGVLSQIFTRPGSPGIQAPQIACSYQGSQVVISISASSSTEAASIAMVIGINLPQLIVVIPCNSIITVKTCNSPVQSYSCANQYTELCCSGPGGCGLVLKATVPIGGTTFNQQSCPFAISAINTILDGPYAQYAAGATCSYLTSQLVLQIPGMTNPTAMDAAKALSNYMFDFLTAAAIPCDSQVTVSTCLGNYAVFTVQCTGVQADQSPCAVTYGCNKFDIEPLPNYPFTMGTTLPTLANTGTTTGLDPTLLPTTDSSSLLDPSLLPVTGTDPTSMLPGIMTSNSMKKERKSLNVTEGSCESNITATKYSLSLVNTTEGSDFNLYCFAINADGGCTSGKCCEFPIFKVSLTAGTCAKSTISYLMIGDKKVPTRYIPGSPNSVEWSNIKLGKNPSGTQLCIALSGVCKTLDSLGSPQYMISDRANTCCPLASLSS